MIESLNSLTKQKVPLSVPLIATYIAKGYTRADISRVCNVSRSAVSQYIDTHFDELGPLVGDDTMMAMKARYVADKAQDKLIELLPEATKKDLFALNAISGTHVDKMKLLSGEATQIFSVKASRLSIKELDIQMEHLEAKLKDITNGEEVGKEHEIIDVDVECEG